MRRLGRLWGGVSRSVVDMLDGGSGSCAVANVCILT